MVALLLAGGLPGCRREVGRPDIVLVTIDTLRADHCSVYGYPVATTPNLDAVAAGGVLFRQAYAESATTAPSHAVLMTGRHFRTLGVGKNGHILAPEAVTLAETLRDSGYATAAFVSSFPLLTRFGFAQGFDVYDDSFVMDEASLGRRKPKGRAHDRFAEATLAHTERWLASRTDDRPLFLWVHFVDPHAPYRAPEKFDANWPAGTRAAAKRYDAEVRYVDRQLGGLLAAVAKHTPRREDFVVVTSDHGEGLGDHGWMAHGINLHEEAVRVPLVASWPGHLGAGKIVEEPVALVDIPRGILELLDIDAKTFAHGRNLFGQNDPSRPVFLQRRDYGGGKEKGRKVAGDMTAVVERGSKLILAPQEDRRELYDLQSDPKEMNNLVGPSYRARPKKSEPAAPQGASPGQEDASGDGKAVSAEHEAAARKLEGNLHTWRDAFPASDSDAPLDEETLKALRSLGYVD
ncbi:MAG: sulfatase [Candidatus Binatia bacterium]